MGFSSRWRIDIDGTVQGVGFRPFIYKLATEIGLGGHVFNHSEGVTIEAEGPEERLNSFLDRVQNELPPLAHIQRIDSTVINTTDETDFKIIESENTGSSTTLISPDIAPCDDCTRELMDTGDRRYAYPFINCTNCGPRYSIIQHLPYDRPMTTMKEFELCEDCKHEYTDPSNRRFHAQPNACERCGPQVKFIRSDNSTSQSPDDPVKQALRSMDDGKIIAVKGLGGYHLACDATNDESVTRLRARKDRDEKPFAIMVGNIQTVNTLCDISDEEERLLISPQRPIVLLHRKEGSKISEMIAPGNSHLGVMLPSTPLHHLLFKSGAGRVLVMTSGNISNEPIAFIDDQAFRKLKDIADAFLIHDRNIHIRVDDSITRLMDGKPLMLRRARGYTPTPIRLSFEMPQLFAVGADLKNTICFTKGHNAFLSQHLGDMENLDSHDSLEMVADHLMHILNIKPEIVTCDMHPDYFSTRFANKIATNHRSPITEVQHHHAHIASCMAENDLPNEKVIGIALDGTGFGTDGTIWGGEVLMADYETFERAAHFGQIPMPGGNVAAKECWRMALAYLQTADSRVRTIQHFKKIGDEKIKFVQQMIEKDINCPMTSSCGRLFDAVAALTGLRMKNSFEGQAAMELEQIADESEHGVYPFTIDETCNGALRINFSPMIAAISEGVQAGTELGVISMRFHNTIVGALFDICTKIDKGNAIHDRRRVCLSGGCFQNAILMTKLKKLLVDKGFTVYTHSLVPPGDGGVALGQAAIAAHLHKTK
ncbi:MAG: carbamoyltransferase HypF [Deltaproteobacteria bacterium]|jgi:hydrogenase maturation protein HypF|nr:carbamoyltransferase HypF [Deltaproteobacteria bacterium]